MCHASVGISHQVNRFCLLTLFFISDAFSTVLSVLRPISIRLGVYRPPRFTIASAASRVPAVLLPLVRTICLSARAEMTGRCQRQRSQPATTASYACDSPLLLRLAASRSKRNAYRRGTVNKTAATENGMTNQDWNAMIGITAHSRNEATNEEQ